MGLKSNECSRAVQNRGRAVVLVVLVLSLVAASSAQEPGTPSEAVQKEMPYFDPFGEKYRTIRSGEGFRTEIFGRSITVEPRDRRSVSAWDAGLTSVAPGVSEVEVLPFASAFLWRHPDENTLFRGIFAGLFNQVLYAKSNDDMGPWEGVLTFENLTIPLDQAEYIDGERLDAEELTWGRLHLGLGFGYRRLVNSPGHDENVYNDNMFEASFLAEPGFLYSDSGKDTADGFVTPQDTFEIRGRLRTRLDKLERNLLELPHLGYAAGGDLVVGARTDWRDWGPNGSEDASRGREFLAFSGYLTAAGGVPFVHSDRHRMIWTLHGGTGNDLDRFSQFRLGGGPSGHGEEYDALARPVLPGAFIEEFTTNHYAVLVGEYRWEPIFFTYLSVRSSVSFVDRERFTSGGVQRQDDFLASIGARVTSGFLFNTRIQLDYNFNAGVIRDGDFGGHEVTVHLSGEF